MEVLSKTQMTSLNLTPLQTGLNSKYSNMRIQLWYCVEMKQWRWTLVDNRRPITRQESGQQPFLNDAMTDIQNTVEYMMNTGQQE